MVTDRLTDYVYFSDWTRKDFPTTINNLCNLLSRNGIQYGFLNHTKDYWCRDYMPIQINEKKFIQYTYTPDYLRNLGSQKYITSPDDVLSDLGINTIKTRLIIDGGNVIKCSDKIIMTEKIFNENRHLQRHTIIAELEKLFECKVIFLPWDKSEIYGHADGIVRWVKENTVLLTAYEQSKYFTHKFRQTLEQYFEVIPLTYTTRPRNRQLSWAYINFLQTKNIIIIPAFNIKEDKQALQQIEKAYSDYQGRITQIDMTEIISHGGALNCISWNIKKI